LKLTIVERRPRKGGIEPKRKRGRCDDEAMMKRRRCDEEDDDLDKEMWVRRGKEGDMRQGRVFWEAVSRKRR
jgi:hypothetical protein